MREKIVPEVLVLLGQAAQICNKRLVYNVPIIFSKYCWHLLDGILLNNGSNIDIELDQLVSCINVGDNNLGTQGFINVVLDDHNVVHLYIGDVEKHNIF